MPASRLYTVRPVRKSTAVKYHASVPFVSGSLVYVYTRPAPSETLETVDGTRSALVHTVRQPRAPKSTRVIPGSVVPPFSVAVSPL